MAHEIDRLGELLRDASLSATILLSLVALAMIACRQPVRRICLARAAIVSVLLLVPLMIFAPFPRVSLDRIAKQSGLLSHPIFVTQRRPHSDRQVATVGAGRIPILTPASSTPPPQPFRVLVKPPPRWLLGLYLVGAGISLSWLVLGHWGLSWVTSRADPVSTHSAELYESLPVRGHRPRLRVSMRIRRPALVGLFRQSILIPAELDLPESADKLRLSLFHELAHAERKDSWFGLASSLAQAFWFFIPPLWWIRAQMRLDQEFMADRSAAGAYGPMQTYASSLLKIASGEPELRTTAAPQRAESQAMSGSALFQRVLMLVQCPFTVEAHPPRWWACTLPGLVLLGTLVASCLTLRGTDGRAIPEPHTKFGGVRTQSFRMSQLVANPTTPAPNENPQPLVYDLPLSLPACFDLSVEVWGDEDSLPLTRVVGIRLQAPRPRPEPPSLPMAWHHVLIRRAAGEITVDLDQLPLPTSSDQETTPALTLEGPAGYPVHFRNLHLTW